ncbi:MAG: hypothetical protein HQK79_11015 [Desulfobacterales bacterium]|nr:hypothetical protein [Desulfobacterales bacterium]MBF0396954.1 hypothetical protein [Desulfobacterales bacterium]
MKTAYDFFQKYLLKNMSNADTLERMRQVISEFAARAPKIVVMKCIDGRVHGSDSKGYPPTTIRFGRTDGNKVSLDKANFWYWNRIDRAVKDAHFNTPGTPALFIAFMHHSTRGFGCASHNSNNAEALNAVEIQVNEVRKTYKESELYVMGGDTNTDIMAETLIFPGNFRIDTEDIISYCNLKNPRDVFHEFFLRNKINDVATSRNVGDQTPDQLMNGINPEIFSNFQTRLNMENYLLREITSTFNKDRGDLKRIIRPDILDYIFVTLDRVQIPVTLIGPILYQIIWNVTYALSQINIISTLSPEALEMSLEHAEELVCYGDGFETLPRNNIVLVKTDDFDALAVAKKVLEKNRKRYKQEHNLLVHINIEVCGEMMSWDDFNDNVGSRILTMLRNVDDVFGMDVAILTSYSYRDQKRFYPIKISKNDHRIVYCADVISEINSYQKFSNISLKAQEMLYKASCIGNMNRQE